MVRAENQPFLVTKFSAATNFLYFVCAENVLPDDMKLLTHNFLNCAAKTCKASPEAFPLKFDQVELTTVEMDYNPQFLINVLPRVDWPALVKTAIEVGSPVKWLRAAWEY